jgi:hypothetical protein
MASFLGGFFGADAKDPREKIYKKFSKLSLENTEIDALLEMFTRLARSPAPGKAPSIDWLRFVLAFGFDATDFPWDPITPRTRFLRKFFEQFLPARSDRIDEEAYLTKMALLLKGTSEQKAKLLFRIYAAPEGDFISKASFQAMSVSVAQTGRHITLTSLVALLEHHKGPGVMSMMSSSNQSTAIISMKYATEPPFSPQPTDKYLSTWQKGDAGEISSFAKSGYTQYSAMPVFTVQPKMLALFDDLPTGNEQALADQIFDEISAGDKHRDREKIREKPFVDWVIAHPAALQILDFYGSLLATPKGLTRNLLVEPTAVPAASASAPSSNLTVPATSTGSPSPRSPRAGTSGASR